MPDHPRRAELLFAVREHDNGWREADAAPPRWDSERRQPHDFLTMPQAARIEIWERGVSRFAGEHPYAALLITRHARRLYSDRRGDEAWQGLLETLDELEQGLAEETGATEEEIASTTACSTGRTGSRWWCATAGRTRSNGIGCGRTCATARSRSTRFRSPERPRSASPAGGFRRGTTDARRRSAASSSRRGGEMVVRVVPFRSPPRPTSASTLCSKTLR